ncbi:MAG: hypothetical protein LBI13_05700 [Streptococcaceae bacterium]|jgi:hypothetical protein|nr:hypothetical protein [Streptococcaceae bacterium]
MKLKIIIVVATTVFLGLIFMGSMKSLGIVTRYPVRTVMTLDAYRGKDKVATLQEIDHLAKTANITIYKEFVTDSGVTKTAKFGKQSVNLKELENYALTGIYYLSADKSSFRQGISADQELSATILNTPLSFFVFYSFIQSNFSSSVWILFFLFFVSVYAVEMSFIQRGMIYRSLGKFRSYVLKNLLLYWFALTISELTIAGAFWLSQGSFDNALVQGFLLALGLSALGLLFLSLLAQLLFSAIVHFNDITGILKHRYVNRVGMSIYLACILASVVIFAITINSSLKIAQGLSTYQKSLSKWKAVQSYVLPSVDTGFSLHAKAGLIDHDWLQAQTKKEIVFNQSFSDSDFLYSKASRFDRQMELAYQAMLKQSGGEIVNVVNTNSGLSSNTRYVSRGFVLLNQKLYPKNSFGKTDSDKLVTLYIPKMYKDKVQDIENNVIAEDFAVLLHKISKADFQVNIIPNQQEIFLMNFNQNSVTETLLRGTFPEQVAKNNILVQLDYKKIEALSDQPLRLMAGNTDPYGVALIKKSELMSHLKAQGLSGQLTSIDKVSADVKLLNQTLTRQLQGELLLIVAISLSSIFILWEYLKNRYQQASKSLVINYLFSGTSRRQEMGLLLPLLSGLVLVAGISAYMTGSLIMLGFILLLYLVEIALIVLFHRKQRQKSYLRTIKDSLE